MASILSRLYRIARSAMSHPWEKSGRWPGGNNGPKTESFDGGTSRQKDDGAGPVPSQVADDLAVFDLAPPSSLDEVRKARNREIKKYHSDHFLNDLDRFETSKQIMQIFNAAYDRLEDYYEKTKP